MNSHSARPYVLAIGGFDPCGGAGILADAKTIEAHNAFALGAITANTIQTEDSFLTSKPESTDFIIAQIDTILARYPIAACKIGLTSSFDQLQAIIETLTAHAPTAPLIWDPILRATASRTDLLSPSRFTPAATLAHLTLLTPNLPEFAALFPNSTPQQIAAAHRCALLIKGGHADPRTPYVEDHLYIDSTENVFSAPRASGSKHGTGCVLSSAIAARLAHGASLPEAVREAQRYVAHFIASHPSRLGLHPHA